MFLRLPVLNCWMISLLVSVANSTIYELLRSHNPISLKKEKKIDLGQVLVNCNSLNVMILLVTVNLKNEHNR